MDPQCQYQYPWNVLTPLKLGLQFGPQLAQTGSCRLDYTSHSPDIVFNLFSIQVCLTKCTDSHLFSYQVSVFLFIDYLRNIYMLGLAFKDVIVFMLSCLVNSYSSVSPYFIRTEPYSFIPIIQTKYSLVLHDQYSYIRYSSYQCQLYLIKISIVQSHRHQSFI